MELTKENLKKFRKKHGLSQGDMSVRVGVSLESYRRWELGYVNPNEENKKRLQEVIKEIEKQGE